MKKAGAQERATFGAGCFWGVEEAFRNMKGVKDTAVGYEGGNLKNPTYEDVCSDKTGHAEVAQIEYDPAEISYEALLKIFWELHDPTTWHQQEPDVGSQYRSVIFYHSPEQKAAAERSKAELEQSKKYSHPIVTKIVPAQKFWKAEEYHQQYIAKGGTATCRVE